MKKLSYKTLYTLWGAMFILTAVLGFAFPTAPNAAAHCCLALTAVVFFLPPFVILHRTRAEENRFHIRLIRWLCVASIVLTVVLLVLNLMSTNWSERVGNALNAALLVVSTPMGCSNFFALPLFLWGTLLTDTFVKK